MREYCWKFKVLAAPLVEVPNQVLEEDFIDGLNSKIWAEVRMLKPYGLGRIIELAQRVEDHNLQFRPNRLSTNPNGAWTRNPTTCPITTTYSAPPPQHHSTQVAEQNSRGGRRLSANLQTLNYNLRGRRSFVTDVMANI